MMNRKNLLVVILFLIFQHSFSQEKISTPNIIYLMADDLGYADLSCYGRKDYQTPYLDKLCSQGVKFLNAYAAAPVCTPTRVAFMTGRYPARLNVGLFEPIAEGAADSAVGLSPKIPSVASLMKKAGYETYLIGKWHLGYRPEYSPNKNGFDYFFGFKAGAIDYVDHGNDLYENEMHITKDGYLTDLLAEKAVEKISGRHTKPFFMAVMFNAPHWPWQAPGDPAYQGKTFESWKEGGSRDIFARMMKNLDSAVGKIVDAVDSLGLSKNTVIIFTSDNGGERFSDNGIYKARKMNLWEGGIREPAFVRWTGTIKANSEIKQVVTTMDWTATILALGRARADPKFPLDGMNILPIITGKEFEIDRTIYWRIFQRKQHKAMRFGRWKYLQDENKDEFLFDINTDPKEELNLKEKYQAVFLRLKNKYAAWEKKMLKPIPLSKKSE
jgi:arylsulfatase A-like enzyme